jgi:hypothetical protein
MVMALEGRKTQEGLGTQSKDGIAVQTLKPAEVQERRHGSEQDPGSCGKGLVDVMHI